MLKNLVLTALFIICYTTTQAQYAGWMVGTWKSRSVATALSGNVISTIQINDIIGESFTGTKTSEINNDLHAKITISISGAFKARGLYLQNGEIVRKEGPDNGQWPDCSACTEENKMIIRRDSLILIDSISGCDNRCNAITFYYRLLSEYDNSTQRYLVDRFGKPSDIIGFQPYQQKKVETDTSNDNSEPIKKNVIAVATVNNAAAEIINQKKRQQEITDSLDLVQQKQQRRINDSLNNFARLEQIRMRTEDSLRAVYAKNRQQQADDSINVVKEKQQHINDSLNNVARLEQIKKQTEDSIRKQHGIEDSLQNVAAANLQKKRTADSLRDVQARKRQQQEITDSLAAVYKQQYNDSLQKVALAKAVPPAKTNNDSSAAEKALTSRTSVLLGSYHITSPDILIELFDNGEIDGDRVSVYHNNEIIVNNQMLDKKAITLNIHADTANRQHEFVLVAENLGSIPPNSALMRVTAGKQIYKLSVNTDMKTNARIEFYYDGN